MLLKRLGRRPNEIGTADREPYLSKSAITALLARQKRTSTGRCLA